jgi:hypothetical protein
MSVLHIREEIMHKSTVMQFKGFPSKVHPRVLPLLSCTLIILKYLPRIFFPSCITFLDELLPTQGGVQLKSGIAFLNQINFITTKIYSFFNLGSHNDFQVNFNATTK